MEWWAMEEVVYRVEVVLGWALKSQATLEFAWLHDPLAQVGVWTGWHEP